MLSLQCNCQLLGGDTSIVIDLRRRQQLIGCLLLVYFGNRCQHHVSEALRIGGWALLLLQGLLRHGLFNAMDGFFELKKSHVLASSTLKNRQGTQTLSAILVNEISTLFRLFHEIQRLIFLYLHFLLDLI